MQRGESNSAVVHPPSTPDVRVLKTQSLEQLQGIFQRYIEISAKHPNSTMPPREFGEQLFARRDAWFVELGTDGLLFLTSVIPELTANFNVVFWDSRFGADRITAVRSILETAFDRFDLKRVSALIPVSNEMLGRKLVAIGFTHEGYVRRGWLGSYDANLYGLISEDVWSVNTTPTNSSV